MEAIQVFVILNFILLISIVAFNIKVTISLFSIIKVMQQEQQLLKIDSAALVSQSREKTQRFVNLIECHETLANTVEKLSVKLENLTVLVNSLLIHQGVAQGFHNIKDRRG